ncbi:MAG: electron transport complex subunit E [Lachnospiraceae bacterium]|jgi:electron transport complex protein RnfE|nr:electron transport complex subunit E [Lachnospiraceae bacterium]
MAKISEHLKRGLVTENPTFIQVLGMCPTLATTTSALNGLGMGLSVTVVLIGANLVISLLRKAIPDKIRIPAFIVVIASFVTIIDLLLQALFYDTLYQSLGLFIPLIVVNCIILGRAEAYASKHGPVDSALDGLGMGLGFTVALTVLGAVREILGAGSLFGLQVMPSAYQPAAIMIMAPGAFFALGILLAVFNAVRKKSEKKKGE